MRSSVGPLAFIFQCTVYTVHVHAIEIVIIFEFNREESNALVNIKSSLKIEHSLTSGWATLRWLRWPHCELSVCVCVFAYRSLHAEDTTKNVFLFNSIPERIHFAQAKRRSHLVVAIVWTCGRCCAYAFFDFRHHFCLLFSYTRRWEM